MLPRSARCLLAFVLFSATPMLAQDTKVVGRYTDGWDSGPQQIAGPGCLSIRGAWEGGSEPCRVNEHEDWLNDITHWRDGAAHPHRLRRIALRPARTEVDAVQFHSAADDGAKTAISTIRSPTNTRWIAISTIWKSATAESMRC